MEENYITCMNCSNKNSIQSKFCIHCGAKLEAPVKEVTVVNQQINQNVQPQVQSNNLNEETPEEKKNGNRLAIISIALYMGGPVVLGLLTLLISILTISSAVMAPLSSLSSLSSLAGIVTMIVGRVKYPKNKALKVIMWIIIGIIALGIIGVILLMAFCFITLSSMNYGNCG